MKKIKWKNVSVKKPYKLDRSKKRKAKYDFIWKNLTAKEQPNG